MSLVIRFQDKAGNWKAGIPIELDTTDQFFTDIHLECKDGHETVRRDLSDYQKVMIKLQMESSQDHIYTLD